MSITNIVPPSPTLAVNERLRRLIEAGRPILHLAFGEAGLPVPDEVLDALRTGGADNGYGPVAGSIHARTAAADGSTAGGCQPTPTRSCSRPAARRCCGRSCRCSPAMSSCRSRRGSATPRRPRSWASVSGACRSPPTVRVAYRTRWRSRRRLRKRLGRVPARACSCSLSPTTRPVPCRAPMRCAARSRSPTRTASALSRTRSTAISRTSPATC